MSSRVQLKPLLAKHLLNTEHNVIVNNTNSYNTYQNELETNLRMILKRYTFLDRIKVRNLLQELDNNLNLAFKILEEEEQDCNRILEQKKLEGKRTVNLAIDQEEQLLILKRSFLKKYKQAQSLKKEKEELDKKNERLIQQVQRLRLMNKMLLERECRQEIFEESRDIY